MNSIQFKIVNSKLQSVSYLKATDTGHKLSEKHFLKNYNESPNFRFLSVYICIIIFIQYSKEKIVRKKKFDYGRIRISRTRLAIVY